MDCKEVKKNLWFFSENTLSLEERTAMENHLIICSSCSKLMEEFSPLWGILEHRERIQSSPFLWTRLNQRLTEYEEGRIPVLDRLKGLVRWVRLVVALMILMICIIAGYTLGNLPQSANGQIAYQTNDRTTALQQFMDSHYLNHLNGFPAGSVEAIYLDVVSGK
jgi:hypothetical protein